MLHLLDDIIWWALELTEALAALVLILLPWAMVGLLLLGLVGLCARPAGAW